MIRVFSRFFSGGAKSALKRAERQLAKGNQSAAFQSFGRAAKAGDIEAQYRVGRAYLDGTGVPMSAREAANWFEKAASRGHPDAQARLAAILMQGLLQGAPPGGSSLFQVAAVPGPDFKAAAMWARRAADSGSPDGMAILATILSSGPEDLRDPAAALDLYRQAAEGDSNQGRLGLALALVRNEPTRVAQEEAARHMEKAAAAGLPMALYLYGVMFDFAIGVEKDEAKAVQFYRKSAEVGVRPGQARYGLALMEGRATKQDRTSGESWLRRAALAGDAEAAALVGDLYAKGGEMPPNYAEAAVWFSRAAELGHATAARALGLLHLTGAGVARDPDEAARWFRKSAEGGDKASQSDLANLLLQGAGGEEDRIRTRAVVRSRRR